MEFVVAGTERASGKKVKIKVEAKDEAHARDRATRHGVDVETCTAMAATTPPPISIAPAPRAVPQIAMPVSQPMPPAQHIHLHNAPDAKGVSGLGIAALVMGIVACLFAWVPFVGMLSLPISGIGILLAIIGFFISLSGRKSGVGMPVAGAIACAVAIVICLVSTIGTTAAVGGAVNEVAKAVEKQQKEDAQRRAAQTATAIAPGVPVAATNTKPPAQVPPTVKVDQSKVPVPQPDGSIRIGDISVKVESVSIGTVKLKDLRDTGESKNTQLIFTLTIKNLSDVKRLEYKTWQGADFAFNRDYAALTDEFDNIYKRISFGSLTKIIGQVENGTIDPGESITDLIVFEKPIAKATKLKLELPGINIGKDDSTLNFEVPVPKR